MNICDVWKADTSLAQAVTGYIETTGSMREARTLHDVRYGTWKILGAEFVLRRVYLKYIENQTVAISNISKTVPGKYRLRLRVVSSYCLFREPMMYVICRL